MAFLCRLEAPSLKGIKLCTAVLGTSRQSERVVYGGSVPSRNAQAALTPGFGLHCASRGAQNSLAETKRPSLESS